MAKRELKPWHYQVTTALAVVTLFCVCAFYVQAFRTFFLTENDPALITIERVKGKIEERRTDSGGLGLLRPSAGAVDAGQHNTRTVWESHETQHKDR